MYLVSFAIVVKPIFVHKTMQLGSNYSEREGRRDTFVEVNVIVVVVRNIDSGLCNTVY